MTWMTNFNITAVDQVINNQERSVMSVGTWAAFVCGDLFRRQEALREPVGEEIIQILSMYRDIYDSFLAVRSLERWNSENFRDSFLRLDFDRLSYFLNNTNGDFHKKLANTILYEKLPFTRDEIDRHSYTAHTRILNMIRYDIIVKQELYHEYGFFPIQTDPNHMEYRLAEMQVLCIIYEYVIGLSFLRSFRRGDINIVDSVSLPSPAISTLMQEDLTLDEWIDTIYGVGMRQAPVRPRRGIEWITATEDGGEFHPEIFAHLRPVKEKPQRKKHHKKRAAPDYFTSLNIL